MLNKGPYSAYMSPDIFNEMQTETSGEFGGLGIEVSMESGVVKVITPIDDTPASRAGIKKVLIPEENNQPHPGSFIEHITNNYYEKFSELEKKDYFDIRGACKFQINEIIIDLKDRKKMTNDFILEKLIKKLFWKFRFITRKFN